MIESTRGRSLPRASPEGGATDVAASPLLACAAFGASETACAAGGLESLRPFVAFISTLTGSISVSCFCSCFDLDLMPLRCGSTFDFDAFELVLAGGALLPEGLTEALLEAVLLLLGGILARVLLDVTSAPREGRADGRSDGRLAGGRVDVADAAETVDAEDFFVLFWAELTLRAGGAEERLPALCFVLALLALLAVGPRPFFGGAFDALEDEDFGVLLVGIFTSSHPSPADSRAWTARSAVESM